MTSYKRNVDELRLNASIFWPRDLSEAAFRQSVIPVLLETQDDFISILNVPVSGLDKLFQILDLSTFSPSLFMKHLVVLTDFGGEMLQRVNSFFEDLFPGGKLEYLADGRLNSYVFRELPLSTPLNNQRLGIDGMNLMTKSDLTDLTMDVIALLIYGGASTNIRTASVLMKCDLHEYIGKKRELALYIRQKYIWVSRVTSGSFTNTLGQLAEKHVAQYLAERLEPYGIDVRATGYLPNVSHRDSRSGSQRPSTFDVVASKNGKYVGIEVSFQVTTNSVIERKGRDALAIYTRVEEAGHKIAYVIDGAGNFQRKTAVGNLCTYSHCTVAFSDKELDVLCSFIQEYLL